VRGLFIKVDTKRVITDVHVYAMSAADVGAGLVHGMKCWAAGTVGVCCPPWIQDAWADGLANNRRGMRETGPQSRYCGPDWPRVRAAVIARDRVCKGCGTAGPLDVHHRIPFVSFADRNDANSPGNLVALCKPCHVAADTAYRRDGSVFMEAAA